MKKAKNQTLGKLMVLAGFGLLLFSLPFQLTIYDTTTISNCDDLAGWTIGYLYLGTTAMIDTVDKTEGIGSLSVTYNGSVWSANFWYNVGGRSLVTRPILSFDMKLSRLADMPMMTIKSWNGTGYTSSSYSMNFSTTTWETKEINLMQPVSGAVPTLGSVATIIWTWNVAGVAGVNWKIDNILAGSATQPQLSVTISPSSATIIQGQSQTFTASPSSGVPPYIYEWFVDGGSVGFGASINVGSTLAVGTYQVYTIVTDSESPQQNATSNVATLTVQAQSQMYPLTVSSVVGSTTVTGIGYTVDGLIAVTGSPISLASGSHTIVMPSTYTMDGQTYNFEKWEDTSTNPQRIIQLTDALTLVATYSLPQPPPPQPNNGYLEIHAFVGTQEVDASVLVVGNATYTTKTLIELPAGSHAITVTYNSVSQTKTAMVTANQTTRVDFTFTSIQPPSQPPTLFAIWILSSTLLVVGVILNIKKVKL